MMTIDCNYKLGEDINFFLEAEKIDELVFSSLVGISRTTLNGIEKSKSSRKDVAEKIYSYIYEKEYRINAVKEEMLKEKCGNVLFHGSRNGLTEVTATGSRDNCDFGNGFYLGESYNQALSFVCENEGSSVYSFRYSLDDLKVKRFECDLEWMIAICHYRGRLEQYQSSPLVQSVIAETEAADVVIAPIADNKMFYIMSQFSEGEINADVALHSLSASKFGLQYVFRTDKALSRLIAMERYYLSRPEREDCRKRLVERGYEIDTKLKLAKREFKTGLYIEELFR